MNSIGWKVEAKDFQGNERITSRVVNPEYRSERPGSYRVKNIERADRIRRRGTNNVGVQSEYSSMEGGLIVTLKHRRFNGLHRPGHENG